MTTTRSPWETGGFLFRICINYKSLAKNFYKSLAWKFLPIIFVVSSNFHTMVNKDLEKAAINYETRYNSNPLLFLLPRHHFMEGVAWFRRNELKKRDKLVRELCLTIISQHQDNPSVINTAMAAAAKKILDV